VSSEPIDLSTIDPVGRAVWRVISAQKGAPIWTEYELHRALARPREEIRAALDDLFLAGLIRPVFHCEGWRRA
jgi:hypothetical protein